MSPATVVEKRRGAHRAGSVGRAERREQRTTGEVDEPAETSQAERPHGDPLGQLLGHAEVRGGGVVDRLDHLAEVAASRQLDVPGARRGGGHHHLVDLVLQPLAQLADDDVERGRLEREQLQC